MNSAEGYLIVLKVDDYLSPQNPRYHGVLHQPPWPSTLPEEQHAMDQYVFGNFKAPDGNLIATLQRAEELLNLFRGSPRELEILRCVLIDPGALLPTPRDLPLGFDVAVINGDCWSIVGDFPNDPRMANFVQRLNKTGLFDNPEDAFRFREQYVAYQLADWDMEFEVVYCERVEGKSNR